MVSTSLQIKRASVIYFSLAMTLTFYHAQKINRQFWPSRSEFHQSIISGNFKSPYQYRVLAPWLAEAGGWVLEKTLRLPPGKPSVLARESVYILQRFIATWMLLIFFHLYLESWFTSEVAFSGTLILGILHLYTFHRYFYQPSSALNILFLTIAAWLILRGHSGWLYPLIIVGTLARETCGLLVPLYLAHGWPKKKCLMHATGLFLVWLIVQSLLRVFFGFRPSFEDVITFHDQIRWASWPLFLFGLFWFIPLVHYKNLPSFLRRAILMFVPPLLIANFLFGKIIETRLFLDLAIVFIPGTFFGLLQLDKYPTDDA